MSDVLLLLRLEHKNMDQLLMLLDDELAQLRRGEVPDFDVLQLTSEYFAEYPDACHHPKEELIFKRLEQRLPELSATGLDLEAQHRELAGLAAGLAAAFRSARASPPASLEHLADALTTFLERYRGHMVFEEQQFFPRAQDLLSESDWAAVKFDLFDRADPVFSLPVEGKYKRLRERIDWLARRHKELMQEQALLVLSKDEARWLLDKGSLVAFNRALEEAGGDMRLTRLPGGGYGLRRGASVIIDIPECSETRAVWCAYYFLKGKEAGDVGA